MSRHAESDDEPRVVDGHDRRMTARVLGQPVRLLLRGARHHVEGHRGLGDLDVVDRPDCLGVSEHGESDRGLHGDGP